MKRLRAAGVPTLLVLCVGIAICQDAAHDLDKSAAKTGQVVKHAGKKVGHATKSGIKETSHGSKVAAKDTAKGIKKASKKTGEGVKDATTPAKPS